MVDLQGFKQVKNIRVKNHSKYDDLLNEVIRTKGLFSRDTADQKRAYSIASAIRKVCRDNKKFSGVIQVGVRERTIVFVKYKKKEEEENA